MFTQVSAQDLVLTEMVKWRTLNLRMNFIVVGTTRYHYISQLPREV